MCLALYLFTNKKIEEKEFDKENPYMHIRIITERERGVLTWAVGNENVYYIGSSQKCGCGWRKWEEWDNEAEQSEKQKDRDSLFKLLTELKLSTSHLIICWEGDQGEDLEKEELLDVAKLKDITFELEECVDYILKYESD